MTFVTLIDLKETLIELFSLFVVDFQLVERRRCGAKNVINRSIDHIAVHRGRRQRAADGEAALPNRRPRFDVFFEQTRRRNFRRFGQIVSRLLLQFVFPLLEIGLIRQRIFGEKRREFHRRENQKFFLTEEKKGEFRDEFCQSFTFRSRSKSLAKLSS